MGLMDDLKDKAGDVMNDPKKRDQVKRMAEEKGITIDEAKKRLMNKQQEQ